MLFITSKKIESRPELALSQKKRFQEADACDNQVYFCELNGSYSEDAVYFDEIGSLNFMREVKEHPCDEILFYFHGFNNQPFDALMQAQALQNVLNVFKGKKYLVIPIIWPCGDKVGIIRDYWDDQKSADMSGIPIGRALAMFVQWQKQNQRSDVPCMKPMNIIAHSMGNRVLKEAMLHWGHYDSYSKVPMLFRNIFMVAADITAAALEPNQKGSYIPYAGKNIVVYYAGDDRALQGSKMVNVDNRGITKRLGHGGPTPESMKQDNVYAVDCDAINSEYDILGHTYFVNKNGIDELRGFLGLIQKEHGGAMFEHMYSCLETGKVVTGKKFTLKGKKKFLGLF